MGAGGPGGPREAVGGAREAMAGDRHGRTCTQELPQSLPSGGDEPTCGAAVRSTQQVSLVLLTSSDPEQEEGPCWPEAQACREGSCSPPPCPGGQSPEGTSPRSQSCGRGLARRRTRTAGVSRAAPETATHASPASSVPAHGLAPIPALSRGTVPTLGCKSGSPGEVSRKHTAQAPLRGPSSWVGHRVAPSVPHLPPPDTEP